ncbi:hypothetical protein [Pontibacter sp. BAB1700]|uniref:hypothetical protein n=1 Tax=Pontibacter sp. BAB1700 TaxID=1144253 RepID=UPI00026BBD28|nr:hypothetical protein [Pontibacter sp. BAB1700]EJF10741.1 hypothetical protein O71_07199 [Pontibacter sp. BAB1700]
MKRTQFAQLAAVLTLFLVLGTVLSYFLLLDMSTSKHLKELRLFYKIVDSCESAAAKAEADYAKGAVKMYFPSGLEMDQNRFPYTFYRQIEEEYGIETIYTGDLGYPYFSCYNLKMDSLLSERIGQNTIESLYREMHREQYPN